MTNFHVLLCLGYSKNWPLPFQTDVQLWWGYNPNTIKSYKILQKLSPKHAAHGVAQSTYPNYRHGKACLSKQPPWRAAGDPRLAPGRSRVQALGPAGALRALFSPPPFLPPSGDSFFRTFPTNPAKVLGLLYTTGMVYNNPNTIKSYKNYLQNTQHMVLRNRPTLIIGTERLACLNSPRGVQLETLA